MSISLTPPRTDTERVIAGVWKELLNLDNVGVHDNLFDLGANSFTMMQANARLRDRLNCSLSLVDLFRFPTISRLAMHLNQRAASVCELQNGETRGQARLEALRRRRYARLLLRRRARVEKVRQAISSTPNACSG